MKDMKYCPFCGKELKFVYGCAVGYMDHWDKYHCNICGDFGQDTMMGISGNSGVYSEGPMRIIITFVCEEEKEE